MRVAPGIGRGGEPGGDSGGSASAGPAGQAIAEAEWHQDLADSSARSGLGALKDEVIGTDPLRKGLADAAAGFRHHSLPQARRRKWRPRPACVRAFPPDIMRAGADRCGRQWQEV